MRAARARDRRPQEEAGSMRWLARRRDSPLGKANQGARGGAQAREEGHDAAAAGRGREAAEGTDGVREIYRSHLAGQLEGLRHPGPGRSGVPPVPRAAAAAARGVRQAAGRRSEGPRASAAPSRRPRGAAAAAAGPKAELTGRLARRAPEVALRCAAPAAARPREDGTLRGPCPGACARTAFPRLPPPPPPPPADSRLPHSLYLLSPSDS
mmetsp:Transcript_9447/g.25265  ORF Transcript_9447/g.25265 Transcript_9447/m.25265 type:complete len:210 (-) Transcript_9447:120-749(-)